MPDEKQQSKEKPKFKPFVIQHHTDSQSKPIAAGINISGDAPTSHDPERTDQSHDATKGTVPDSVLEQSDNIEIKNVQAKSDTNEKKQILEKKNIGQSVEGFKISKSKELEAKAGGSAHDAGQGTGVIGDSDIRHIGQTTKVPDGSNKNLGAQRLESNRYGQNEQLTYNDLIVRHKRQLDKQQIMYILKSIYFLQNQNELSYLFHILNQENSKIRSEIQNQSSINKNIQIWINEFENIKIRYDIAKKRNRQLLNKLLNMMQKLQNNFTVVSNFHNENQMESIILNIDQTKFQIKRKIQILKLQTIKRQVIPKIYQNNYAPDPIATQETISMPHQELNTGAQKITKQFKRSSQELNLVLSHLSRR